ncbi:MAG: hypothetical protein LBP63_10870 [Prevotellaceae bacterium]|nr:hypothetical protein [Prevotellaceae bacterium]
MNFNEPVIPFSEICDFSDKQERISPLYSEYYDKSDGTIIGKFHTVRKLNYNAPAIGLIATRRNYHPLYKRELNDRETLLAGTFPTDYNYLDCDLNYIVGMSVPPVMTAQIAYQIFLQWLKK